MPEALQYSARLLFFAILKIQILNMKKILGLLLLFVSIETLSQRATELQFRAGAGIAVYKSDINLSYDFGGTKISQDTTDGAATTHFPIEIRYEVSEHFNLGIDMKFGKYLYAEEDKAGKSNQFIIVGLGGEGVIYSLENARVYLGLGFNSGKLHVSETRTAAQGAYTETSDWQGSGYRFNLGTIIFIAKGPIGLNLNFGYDQHTFNLKSIKRDGTNLDLTNYSGTLKVGGPELAIGLVFRIRP